MTARLSVVVPAAGAGRRMRPLGDARPKPLLEVAGAAMIDHALAPLRGVPFDEAVFVVPPDDRGLRAHVLARGPSPARFVVQPEPLGQADAVARACAGVAGPVLVLLPDTIHDVDLGALARLDLGAAPDGILHVRRVDDPARFGVAVIEDGRVARLVEKPKDPVSDLAVVGVYWLRDAPALERACRAAAPGAGGETYLAAALQVLIDGGARLEARPVATWLDCGTPEDLRATDRALRAGAVSGAAAGSRA